MPAVVNGDTCNGCAGLERLECIFNCPYDAVTLADGKALVDKQVCDDCKICVEVCPVQAIGME